MLFSRGAKELGPSNFNPPPGYYHSGQETLAVRKNVSFPRGPRFQAELITETPGPGTYSSQEKEMTRKRLIEQSLKEHEPVSRCNKQQIKISSIPSIPKKSAARVYEELAPGILILHQEEYENSNVGPGSYNIDSRLIHRQSIAHRIPPPKEARLPEPKDTLSVPTIAEEIRNERRLRSKQNIIKRSTIDKSEVSPSDLCLEVIILRQKLLRGNDNPPPGHYYNEELHSSFRQEPYDRPPDCQVLLGKEERFKDSGMQLANVGPGSYSGFYRPSFKGGYMPRESRTSSRPEQLPGPGSYLSEMQGVKVEPKGNYPPIFGSGSNRFCLNLEASETPGPGTYQLERRKGRKHKYIKVLRDNISTHDHLSEEIIIGFNNGLAQTSKSVERPHRRANKNTYSFASKVRRFMDRTQEYEVGPGVYETSGSSVTHTSFNRGSYIGPKGPRFEEDVIRPRVGPGTYNALKERKISNVRF